MEVRRILARLRDRSVYSLIDRFNASMELSDVLKGVKRRCGKDLEDLIGKLCSKLNPDTSSIAACVDELEDMVPNGRTTETRVCYDALVVSVGDLESRGSVVTAIAAFEAFVKISAYLKRKRPTVLGRRWKTNVERLLHEALEIIEIKEDLAALMHALDFYTDHSPSRIFRKRGTSPAARTDTFDPKPRTIEPESASREDWIMMCMREAKLDEVWRKMTADPKPYETLKRVEEENRALRGLLGAEAQEQLRWFETDNIVKERDIASLEETISRLRK